MAVEAQKGGAVVANTVAAAMGVASIVVGQYYMTQINAELGAISDNISKVSDFQNIAGGWNKADKEYWQEKGWLGKARPWKQSDGKEKL